MENYAKKTFIFDFDSTIFPGETLDEIISLALEDDPDKKSKSLQVQEICTLGMTGKISMEESLLQRLDIAAPDKKTINKYVEQNKNRIDGEFRGILMKLQKSHEVLIVSGGFEEWIVPILDGILPAKNVHANKIKNIDDPMFFENIIRRDKEEIIKSLNIKSREIFIIGDGATDFSVFENKIATSFIGAGFYKNRPEIKKKADTKKQKFFTDMEEFLYYLDFFC